MGSLFSVGTDAPRKPFLQCPSLNPARSRCARATFHSYSCLHHHGCCLLEPLSRHPENLPEATSNATVFVGGAPSRVPPRPQVAFVELSYRRPFRRWFVPGTTRQHAHEIATALQRTRPAPAGSYSSHTPRPGRLNHVVDRHAPGTTSPGCPGPSPISDVLPPASHVARRCYPSGHTPYVPPSRTAIVSAIISIAISPRERRRWGYPGRVLFAVRPRLSPESLASPAGPLMVELFAAPGFAGGPRAVSLARTWLSPAQVLPTPAELYGP